MRASELCAKVVASVAQRQFLRPIGPLPLTSPHLEKLREIVPKLPPLDAFVSARARGTVAYGKAEMPGLTLHNSDIASVQLLLLQQGDAFPLHTHEEREFVVLLSGEARMTVDGETLGLQAGSSVYLAPQSAHSFDAALDCTVLAITMPPSSAYPNE